MWVKVCREMEFNRVMKKLAAHIGKSPFPPVIADIAAYPEEENSFLEKARGWARKGGSGLSGTSDLAEKDRNQPGYRNSREHYELLEVENMILGAIFLQPEAIFELTLEPLDFSTRKNQLIFQAMKELHHEARSII